MDDIRTIKEQLYNHCKTYTQQKIDIAQNAIQAAQQAANEETKSSVGDKYETGRAMMQLEKQKYAAQLDEGIKLQKVLAQITPQSILSSIQLGSIVITTQANYYIAISAGKVKLRDTLFFTISLGSPIGQALKGLTTGDTATFRQQKITIKSIH